MEESFHVRLNFLTANPMGKRKKERKEKKSLPDDKYYIMLYGSQINEFCTRTTSRTTTIATTAIMSQQKKN